MEGHDKVIPYEGTLRRWHPRITPYRLSFILSTAGLGIAKTILVNKGATVSSTTVEWVSGVVLTLCFQFMNSFENTAPKSHLAKFIFTYDCSEILWKVVFRPAYSDEEDFPKPSTGLHLASSSSPTSAPTFITPYRLLVSSVAIIFGGAKMICAYMGMSSAMNTLDWAITVPLALILYYIGLFENNTANMGVSFFKKDSSQHLISFVIWASGLNILLIGTFFSYWWILFFWNQLQQFLAFNFKPTPLDGHQTSIGYLFTRLESFHDLSVKAFIVTVLASGAVTGILPVSFALLLVHLLLWDRICAMGAFTLTNSSHGGRAPFRATTSSSDAPSMDKRFSQVLPRFSLPSRSYVLIILWHLFALFLLVDVSVLLFGLAIRLFDVMGAWSLLFVVMCGPPVRVIYLLLVSLYSEVSS